MQIYILLSKELVIRMCTITKEARKYLRARRVLNIVKIHEKPNRAPLAREPTPCHMPSCLPWRSSPLISVKQRAKMKARSLFASVVATCALSSGPAAVSAAANHVESSSSVSTAAVPEVAGNAEATRRVLAQTKEERVSCSVPVADYMKTFYFVLSIHKIPYIFI